MEASYMGEISIALIVGLIGLSQYFRFKERSYGVFQNYGLKLKRNYPFSIPLKEIIETYNDSTDELVKAELERCIKYRRYFWVTIIIILLVFFSIIFLNS